ncbi:ribosome maturation factor RimM [Alkalicoccus luteus]|uniref:Ribosome maturation factor RimM n=1 Tax=Alkalicoccus luteus TaxID=1237094 RepID=A0A969PVE7_9BACI|nr:ribosome maturation factor RimM [Alkalicoccus luteus]NJP36377.1 ribosome maturation factor RimM [Alkalicoccus luteus]
MTDWLNVGKIVNTHGIRGEVRVISRTDFPERRYRTGAVLTAFDSSGATVSLTVSSWRQHKNFDLLTFEEIQGVTEAEALKERILKIEKSSLEDDELADGEFYYHDIIGLQAYDEAGNRIGTVKEILQPGANDVWVLDTEKGELLLPYIEDVVLSVNQRDGFITVRIPEGLE